MQKCVNHHQRDAFTTTGSEDSVRAATAARCDTGQAGPANAEVAAFVDQARLFREAEPIHIRSLE